MKNSSNYSLCGLTQFPERRTTDALAGVADAWLHRGLRVARAVITRSSGSAPFDVGAAMLVREDGRVFGSVSNGCVESAIADVALEALRERRTRECRFTSEDTDELGTALTCGGSIVIEVCEIGEADIAGLCEGGPDRRLLLAGANDYARAVTTIASLIGYGVTIVDPRPAFAIASHFPQARIVRDWPDAYIASLRLTDRDAILSLSHDRRFDSSFLAYALRSDAFYVGAIGSRRAQRERRKSLAAVGVPAKDLSRLHAPAGFDLGGRTAAETAIALLAEITAVRYGRRGGTLKNRRGPIHSPRQ